MSKNMIFGIGALFLISVISLGVMAYQGNMDIKGPNYNTDVHEQLEAAIEAVDYDSWISIRQENNLPTRGRIFQVINAGNFDRYAELHNAVEAGDIETAEQIREELGLGQGMMRKSGSKGTGCQGQCSMQGKGAGTQAKGNGQRMQQYIDADNDGACDNYALHHAAN
ncbi:MAG: hypothetical protein HGA85_06465 [Nanoarchaeota archaeon]|nr:hypothetical protein [Nanoarchaeota archaeon]